MCKSDYLKKIGHRAALIMSVGASVILTACGGKQVQVGVSGQGTTANVTQAITETTEESSTEPVTELVTAGQPTTEAVTEPATEAATEPMTEVPTQPATEAPTQPAKTVICLDPGHGGESQGTHYIYDDVEIEEKNLNYYIALRLKKYLEQYDNIEVVIDRGENEDPSFETRISFAKENNADYIVSLHNNSKSRDDIEPSGCMAITTCSHYQAESAVNDDVRRIKTACIVYSFTA